MDFLCCGKGWHRHPLDLSVWWWKRKLWPWTSHKGAIRVRGSSISGSQAEAGAQAKSSPEPPPVDWVLKERLHLHWKNTTTIQQGTWEKQIWPMFLEPKLDLIFRGFWVDCLLLVWLDIHLCIHFYTRLKRMISSIPTIVMWSITVININSSYMQVNHKICLTKNSTVAVSNNRF